MIRFTAWIRSIPVWVWLLLVSTQVLTIFDRSPRVIELDHELAALENGMAAEGQLFQQKVDDCRITLWNCRTDMIGASLLLTVFWGLRSVG
jgi:hypothetical protein